LFLAVSSNNCLISLKSGESKIIKLKCMFPILGINMREIYDYYKPFIFSDFKIIYVSENNKLKFSKSEDFHVYMYVDDTLITDLNSVLFYKTTPPPNFSDTFISISTPNIDLLFTN